MSIRRTSGKEKPPPDEGSAYEIAVRALARRARSSAEVRALLARRKTEPGIIDSVLARLREHGYLDDARFARSYAALRLEADRLGKRRVRRDLLARRVHPELIQNAINDAYEQVDETKLLREYLRRKLRLSQPPQKPSALASLYRRLLRAGFASDTIIHELRAMGGAPSFRPGARAGESRSPSGGVDPDKWQEWVNLLADAPPQEPEEPQDDPEGDEDNL